MTGEMLNHPIVCSQPPPTTVFCEFLLMSFSLGALTNLQNNENQLPFDLSAKNPEVGRLLMVRGELLSGTNYQLSMCCSL